MEVTSNYQDKLNNDIQDILLDIFGKVSYDIQLELASLIKQIYRINHLIYRQENSRIKIYFKKKTYPEPILWLEEVKNILLIVKSGNINRDVIQKFRLNLESELNTYQYLFLGDFSNFFLRLYHVKSTPFKIFVGLLITTTVSLITMHFVIREINVLSQEVIRVEKQVTHSQNNVQVPETSKPTHSINSLNDNEIITTYFTSSLIYTAIAGVLGSITSILLRIIQFKEYSYEDPLIPFFFGMFKPLIGLLLGIFFFFLIKSNTIIQLDFMLVSNPVNTTNIDSQFRQNFFLFTCAFLIGFSERFASDILRRTELSVNHLESSSEKTKEEQ